MDYGGTVVMSHHQQLRIDRQGERAGGVRTE
jgi:hypothetical protein